MNEINGKSTVKDLLNQNDNWSEADLQKALDSLAEQGYIRDSVATSTLETGPTVSATPSKAPAPPPASGEGGFEDLDFTAAPPAAGQSGGRAAGEAAAQAKRLAEEAAKREAEERAKREAAERARREAEAQAKRQAEEAAKREAAERAKRETAEQARREAEAHAKRQAEEAAKREAEERAKREAAVKREAEERAKLSAAERARHEAEESAKRLREAAAAAKRETEERAKREAAEQARRDAEERTRREAADAARREAEERSKREAAEQARREVEEKARRQAEEAAKREAEERAKREAAEQARRDAEERTRREAAEAAEREAEERARREAAEQARREAEEKARRQAEEAARREAEERAKREAAERARREAEEQARRQAEEADRREAEERAKREAAEQALREVEERNKRQAEEAERRAAEEREKREEAEQARREAEEEAARQEAEERARQKSDKQAQLAADKASRAAAAGPRSQAKWVKLSVVGTLVLAVLGLGLVHVISFDGQIPQLEKAAAEQFQQPVKIKSLHLSLMPPHWRIEGVSIGKSGQIKAPRIKALATLGSLFSEPKVFSAIEIDSPVLDEEGLGWLLFGASHGQGIRYGRLSATNAKLDAGGIELPALDVNADIAGDGNWQKIAAESADKKTSLELQHKGEAVEVKLNAASFAMPFGPIPVLDDLSATGTARHGELAITEFKSRLFGGMLSGRAKLKWGALKSLDGELLAQRVEAARLLPGLFDGGELEGKALFSLHTQETGQPPAAPHLDGSFVVRKGVLAGVDLARLLQGSGSSGRTQFAKLEGDLVHDNGKTQVRQLRLEAGALSASGNVETDEAAGVRGQVSVELAVAGEHRRAGFALSGRLKSPYAGSIDWKRR